MIKDKLETQEFYDLMQTYRTMPITRQDLVIKAFEAVKSYIRSLIYPTKNDIELWLLRLHNEPKAFTVSEALEGLFGKQG